MARGDKTRAPVDVSPEKLLMREDLELEKPKHQMVAIKTKYLPNLKDLVFPKLVYEQAERLVLTPLLTYDHDPVAALKLRGERCASFELPKELFPQGAPIWKITFLPEALLPLGFDAGGVFGIGVLARKFYPTGLLSAEHKGQTPALFVGHRSSNYIVHKDAQGQARAQCRPKPLTPAPSPAPAYQRSVVKPSVADAADMNRRLVRNNISVAEVIIMPAFPKPPSRYPSAIPVQMQYNMYVPDLSQVIFAMQDVDCITVAIISTVHQPNVPEVALSTMGSETCPRFELPTDVFPVDTNRLGPRFLPQRFLPDFCDAGCVFPPGSLPDSVFQGAIRTRFDLEQYHYSMTPPLFVGRRRQRQSSERNTTIKIEPIAVQMEKMALKNVLKPPVRPAPVVHSRAKGPSTIPAGAQRSNAFKKTAAAGKPKGFVLIESDHVPRGAIRTDFFGAYLMGCFFKITPCDRFPVTFGTVGEIRSTSDGIALGDSTEDGEYLDFQDAKEYPQDDIETDEYVGSQDDVETEDYMPGEAEEDKAEESEDGEYEAGEYDPQTEEIEDGENQNQTDKKPAEKAQDQKPSAGTSKAVAKSNQNGNFLSFSLLNINLNTFPETLDDYDLMDLYDSDSTESVGFSAYNILSYYTVDSNLDDIAEAAGNLDTARFEVIVHPSELPGINVDIAIEQFREVLQCRNEIRAKMAGKINAHAEKMEADRKSQLGTPAPCAQTKRVYRKPCSHCGKYH